MSNNIDKFQTHSIGSYNTIHDYTATIDASGDFTKISELDVILNSWRTILMTPKGSYLEDPTFGSNIHRYIFEMADLITEKNIKRDLERDLKIYDSRATIADLQITFFSNRKGFQINMLINYKGEKKPFQINLTEQLISNN